jgi:hypothetical protein
MLVGFCLPHTRAHVSLVDAQVGGDVRNRTAALEGQPHTTLKQCDRKQSGRAEATAKTGLHPQPGACLPAASQALG